MERWIEGLGPSSSTLLLVVVAVMAISGGSAVALVALVLTSELRSAARVRRARRAVRVGSSARCVHRRESTGCADWLPPWLATSELGWSNARAVWLARILAGRYARSIEARLQFEPSAEQLCQATSRAGCNLMSAAGLVGVVVVMVLSLTSGRPGFVAGVAFAAPVATLGARAPWVLADRWLARRTERANAELPVLIDTVSLCTRAGMSFDQSLDLYARRFDGHLSRMLTEAGEVWRSGIATRSQELDRLSQRIASPAVESFFGAVVQSMDLGTPLAAALDAQAGEVRAQRHAALEERISKLPVKMLIPIGLFTLPAMLILLLAPIAIQVVAGLG